MRASSISAVVYQELKKRMGIDTPTKTADSMQILAEVEMEVVDRLEIDVLPLDVSGAAWAGMDASQGRRKKLFCGNEVVFPPDTRIAEEAQGDWVLLDASDRPYARMPKDGLYFDFIRPTMAGRKIDPKAFKPSDTIAEKDLRTLSERAKFLHENTDKAVLGWGPSISMLGLSALLSDNITQGCLDEWLIMMVAEKETAHEMMGRYVEAVIKRTELCHEAIGDNCMVWGVASDDAGTQRDVLMSADVFAEMVKPHYKRLCDWVHRNTNWKTFLHTCGSVYKYIPHWIEAGVDILNPVQISAANMQPRKLMGEFGGKIVFWGGGCDTQHYLPNRIPEEIREHVRENMSVFGPGEGGYVFTQVHNIQPDVPVENVEAMLGAAREFAGCGVE